MCRCTLFCATERPRHVHINTHRIPTLHDASKLTRRCHMAYIPILHVTISSQCCATLTLDTIMLCQAIMGRVPIVIAATTVLLAFITTPSRERARVREAEARALMSCRSLISSRDWST